MYRQFLSAFGKSHSNLQYKRLAEGLFGRLYGRKGRPREVETTSQSLARSQWQSGHLTQATLQSVLWPLWRAVFKKLEIWHNILITP